MPDLILTDLVRTVAGYAFIFGLVLTPLYLIAPARQIVQRLRFGGHKRR